MYIYDTPCLVHHGADQNYSDGALLCGGWGGGVIADACMFACVRACVKERGRGRETLISAPLIASKVSLDRYGVFACEHLGYLRVCVCVFMQGYVECVCVTRIFKTFTCVCVSV